MADPVSAPHEVQSFDPVQGCWFLTGPTASGKTSVGLELAELLDAEIISLDSMAIYRGMDVGTAKPTVQQRKRVPHHLVDIVDPQQEFSLSQYVAAAHRAAGEIRSRSQEVLFVGGTPLYLKALLRGLYPGPPADWGFRKQIEEELKVFDVAALHARLRQVDPLSAARLHPHDKRRIIRALEVYKLTGRPLSHQQTQFDEPLASQSSRVIVMSWARELLHRRIETRVDQMFRKGLVDEVRGLLATCGQLGRTAAQAVGYREVVQHLQGEHDLDAAIDLVKTRTRQFARRQDTWFRGLSECRWFPQSGDHPPRDTAEQILDMKW